VAEVTRTLEDTPFYARSLVRKRLLGSNALAVHESLDLDRFRQPWVQCLLPFRMPRFPRRRVS
jgi:carotenoid 1,2-hydratase